MFVTFILKPFFPITSEEIPKKYISLTHVQYYLCKYARNVIKHLALMCYNFPNLRKACRKRWWKQRKQMQATLWYWPSKGLILLSNYFLELPKMYECLWVSVENPTFKVFTLFESQIKTTCLWLLHRVNESSMFMITSQG